MVDVGRVEVWLDFSVNGSSAWHAHEGNGLKCVARLYPQLPIQSNFMMLGCSWKWGTMQLFTATKRMIMMMTSGRGHARNA
eukprot:1157947-Pelagomonas_calceolata.AAC.4